MMRNKFGKSLALKVLVARPPYSCMRLRVRPSPGSAAGASGGRRS